MFSNGLKTGFEENLFCVRNALVATLEERHYMVL